jgi:hypothetical protein
VKWSWTVTTKQKPSPRPERTEEEKGRKLTSSLASQINKSSFVEGSQGIHRPNNAIITPKSRISLLRPQLTLSIFFA